MIALLPESERGLSLANFVFAMYALFLAGFYFVPNAVDLYKFYIFAVFLPGLLLMREALREAWSSDIFRALTLYLAYLLASSLWSADIDLALLWRDARYIAYIWGFVLLTVHFLRIAPALSGRLLETVTLIAGASALLAVIILHPWGSFPAQERMVGFGITDNPNPSAFVYGLAGLVALHATIARWGSAAGYVLAACTAALWIFVLFTQSNTGLLALLGASALLFTGNQGRGRIALAGVALLGAAVLFLSWSLGLLGSPTDSGFNERIPIWQHCLQLWRDAPIFGQGLQKVIVIGPGGNESILNYAHSLFLANLRDGGLVGLGLMLLTLFAALRTGLASALSGRGSLYLAMLSFGLVVIIGDVDQAVTRPRELWLILWLPLACLVAQELAQRQPKSAA
ncbi:MAG: hypothetical protein HKN19_03920 [Halioglobus sp.]|nr:hypothetical protein [Halioglobus sp.]